LESPQEGRLPDAKQGN